MKQYTDHNNKTTKVGLNDKDELTFEQSQDAMQALNNDLIDNGILSKKDRISIGFGVVFPHIYFTFFLKKVR